ncbi:polycystic kidney disease protein 1-like 2, partial [Biomphalaria glabrata]
LCPSTLIQDDLNQTNLKPTCLKDWKTSHASMTVINIDVSTDTKGMYIFLDNMTEELKNFTSHCSLAEESQAILIVLSCYQNNYRKELKSIPNENSLYILHNVNQTSENIIYIKNNYTVDVYMELSNDSGSHILLIPSGGLDAINFGNSLVYNAPIVLRFLIIASKTTLTKNVSLIYKESFSGLNVNFSDVAIIGKEYNITATVISGSDVIINFNVLSPIDNKSLVIKTDESNNKTEKALFKPRYETNYTIQIHVTTPCSENMTRIIIISAVFEEMCPRNANNETPSNITDILEDSLFLRPTCVKDGSHIPAQIIKINIDLTTDSNRGYIYSQNVSADLFRNWTFNARCQYPEMFPMVVVFDLSCQELFQSKNQNAKFFREFDETIFMLHNVQNTCERLFYFQNDYVSEIHLQLSESALSKNIILDPTSTISFRLASPKIYDFTNLTFSFKTNKEIHSMNLRLKYEALKDLQIQYKPVILVKEVLHITASVTSGCNTNFTIQIVSPNVNYSLANLEKKESTSNLKLNTEFQAFEELNFTFKIEVISTCGETLMDEFTISAVYPELCFPNETSAKVKNTSYKSMPLCVMDMSEANNSITQIDIDLTSLEPARFNVISNYSWEMFNNLTASAANRSSALRETFLYHIILLSCLDSEFDGLASNKTIYILQKKNKISGHKFLVINNYYNDTLVNVLNGTIFGPKHFLPKSFMSDPITDELNLTFELTYHRKFYNKSITLKYHEVMSELHINHEQRVLVGVPCIITASVTTGVIVNFDFQIKSPRNSAPLLSNEYNIINNEDKVARLNFTPDFVGIYSVLVITTSFCKEIFKETIKFDSQLCSNITSTTAENITKVMADSPNSPRCITSWDDKNSTTQEFYLDLQLTGVIGYKSINTSSLPRQFYNHSSSCKENDVPVQFNIILTCFSTTENYYDSNDSFWFNSSIYIIRRLNHPCEEVAVIYNNYTFDVKVVYTVLSVWKEIVIPPKNISSIILDSSFSSDNLSFSFIMPYAKKPYVKILNLIHFDVLYGLNVSYVRDVLVDSLWDLTATIISGQEVNFTFIVSQPERSFNKATDNNNITKYITDKEALFSFIPMDEGRYYITVLATSKCGEVLNETVSFFAHCGIQNSNLDKAFEITKHRKSQRVFYPKDIVAVAMKATDNLLTKNRPTQPNCTINWGDKEELHEVNVDLTPNQSSGYIYVRSHNYTLPGQYTVDVECHNVMTRVSDTFNFTIVSPVDQADVFLAQSLVPFNAKTSHGIGNVRLIQNYIYTDYPDLIITLDFGTSNSNWNVTFVKDTFDYYYSYSEKGEYDIKTVIEAFGVNKTYNFHIRVGYFINFVQEKKRWLVRIKEPCTFTLVRYSANGTLNVKFFRDVNEMETLNKIFENGETVMNVTFNYTDETVREAKALIEVDSITEIESYKFETFIPCISTLDFFDATYRNMLTPLEAWLTTLPTISGRAERTLDCNITDIFYMKWQVWKMENNSFSSNIAIKKEEKKETIVKNFKYVIQSNGLYKIQLQISLDRKSENETDFMYLKVTYPPIAVEIKYGAFRQAKLGENLTLDAQSETKELAASKNSTKKFTYRWSCYLLSSKQEIPKYTHKFNTDISFENLTNCNISLNSNAGKITISTLNFSLDDVALFYVVAKVEERNGSAVQVVEMTNKKPIDLVIGCIWNCLEKIVKGERTVFEAKISNADQNEMKSARYVWSVYKYVNDIREEKVQINSTITSYFFDIDGELWEEDVTYSILLQVSFDNATTLEARKVVVTNCKPYGGTCSVHPSVGLAADTTFLFTFPGWKDEEMRTQNSSIDTNFGLLYEVYQNTTAGFYLVYSGNEISASTFLTEGAKGNDGECLVIINIFDMFRAKATCTLTVMIQANALLNQQSNDSDSFFSTVDKRIQSVEMIGDPIKITQRAASLSTYISSQYVNFNGSTSTSWTTTPAPTGYTTKQSDLINTYVVKVSQVIQNDTDENPGLIQIFANSLAIVTNNSDQLSTKSMETASSAAKTLTDSLTKLPPVELSALNPCLEDVYQIVSNIITVQNIESKNLYSLLEKTYDSYSEEEIKQLVKNAEDELKKNKQVTLSQFANIVENVTNAWENVFRVIKKMTNPSGHYETKKEKYTMTLQKIAPQRSNLTDVFNLTDPKLTLGFTFNGINTVEKELQIKVVKTVNIYTHGLNAQHINTDILIGSIEQDNGNKINITNPTISFKSNKTNCSFAKESLFQNKFNENDASHLFYHKFFYNATFLHFCIKILPTNPFLAYKLFFKMDVQPTDLVYDVSKTVTSESFSSCEGVCFEPGQFKKSGTIYIGLQPFLDSNAIVSQKYLRRKREAINNNLEAPYYFEIVSAACFSWDHALKDWEPNKCRLSNLTTNVVCTCDSGSEVVSGMSFNVFPNTIHFATVFSKFDIKGQGLVLGVLISLYLLFTCIALWAHYMDRKAMFQWGVFPLSDNYAYDDYFYLITVHTGLRKSARTTSNVSFDLSGEHGDTGIRRLSDGVKKGFPTASVYHFVMACPTSLGELQCLKIWHDSTGKGSNSTWYLNRIDVVDLHTGKIFYFICDEWLAAEYGIEKTILVSDIEDLEKLKNVFFTNTKEHITDDHMWLSLFIRPQRSNFSRVERALCCLAFLLLSMITSAMFYKDIPGIDRKQTKADLELGIIRVTYDQLFHSLVSAVITAVPMIFIMMVFRKARPRKKAVGCLCINEVKEADLKDEYVEKKNEKSWLPWMAKLESQLEALEKLLLLKPTSDNMQGTWPHSLRYIAWAILFLAIIISSLFVLLYSMEWGKDVTETWMSTFFLTFLQSLLIVDPVKVVVISVIVSLLLRKAKIKQVDQLDLDFIAKVNKQYGVKERFSQLDISYAPPLSKSELKAAKLRRKIHIMIDRLIREFIIHFMYLLIVSSLCHANRSSQDYNMYRAIFQQVVNGSNSKFLEINSSAYLFQWIPRNLTPWLFPVTKLPSADKNHFTKVNDLYRLGTPRLRQIRMMKEQCSLQRIKVKDCVYGYTLRGEETGDFYPGWTKEFSQEGSEDVRKAWTYTSAQDIWGLPIAGEYGLYGGGGYIAQMFLRDHSLQMLKDLKDKNWLDRQTRAVFIEFTLYCPNTNHFAFVILLAEFMETGGILPFFSIYPFTVHYPPGILGTYLQLCQLVGTIFTFIGLLYVVFIFGTKKWLAFKNFWFMLDVLAVLTGISTAAMMFLRLKFTNSVLRKIKESRSQFVNMYHVVVWDSAYTLCLAILVAIGCIRLLKLASYSEKTMKVFVVLSKAMALLPNFALFLFLVLLSFIMFGWITFGTTSTYFKNFISTSETLFTGILGRSSFKDTNSPISDHWINILFFCMFVGVVVIFLINFFLAVLMDLLRNYDQKVFEGENTKVFIVLWDMFMRMLGSKRNPLDRLKGNDNDNDHFGLEVDEEDYLPCEKAILHMEERFLKLCQPDDKKLMQLMMFGKQS